jgi:hypothetical protein
MPGIAVYRFSPRGRRLSSGLRAVAYGRRTSERITSPGFRRYSRHFETRGHHEHSPPMQRAPRHCGHPWSQPQHASRQPPSELICRTFRGKFAASTHCNRGQSEGDKLAKQLTSVASVSLKSSTCPQATLKRSRLAPVSVGLEDLQRFLQQADPVLALRSVGANPYKSIHSASSSAASGFHHSTKPFLCLPGLRAVREDCGVTRTCLP